jgi:CRP/FNR family transcriptional regulator, cyclic AMP receptor protein
MHEFNVTEVAQLYGATEVVRLRAGDFLFKEGDNGDALYIVRSGSVRIISGDTVYETVTAGGVVGEMALVDKGMSRSASVIAATTAELIRIDVPKFLALVARAPDFALTIMRVAARRLRVMNWRYRGGRKEQHPDRL